MLFILNPFDLILTPINYHYAGAVFLLCGVTDWLDGYIARNYKQISRFGAFFDPFADKLVIISSLVLILYEQPGDKLLAVAILIVILREFCISGLRENMSEIGMSKVVAVSFVGKLKTTIQFISIFLMVIGLDKFILDGFGLSWFVIGDFGIVFSVGYYLFIFSLIFTLVSMVLYLKKALPYIFSS